MAETAQNGLRQERKGYAGKFKAGMRGGEGAAKVPVPSAGARVLPSVHF